MTASRIVITAFIGLCSVAAVAQVPPPATNSANGPDQPGQNTGEMDRGTRDNRLDNRKTNGNDPNGVKDGAEAMPDGQTPPSGPDIVDDPNATPEQKASAEYSGPAVLSRGISASEPMNPKNIRFIPSVGLEYLVNSGLTGVALQSNGKLPDAYSSGMQLNYSLRGEKVFKKDVFSLSFLGNLYHYVQQSSYDGSDNSLSMTWRHKLSRHLSFGVRVSAQQYNRNNLLLSGANFINSGIGTTLVTATPATEAFDGRVFSLYTEGDVTYQMTSRLSINLSGGGFMTRRRSSSLYGDTGSQAGADLAYRITRQTTTGVYYAYTHFDFTGIYGATNVNTVGLTYSIAFSPTTQLNTRVGASRLEITGLSSVALDPVLALLLGSPTTIEAIYKVRYTPDFNIQLRRKVSSVAVTLSYERGVTPGNGVILTSIRQSAAFGANYKAGRLWNLSSTAGYDTLNSFGSSSQRYASVFFGSSVSRILHRGLNWHTRADFHHYTFDNTGFLRNSFVFSTGLVWSPGDVLERVW